MHREDSRVERQCSSSAERVPVGKLVKGSPTAERFQLADFARIP
jgi:hypothetical protein